MRLGSFCISTFAFYVSIMSRDISFIPGTLRGAEVPAGWALVFAIGGVVLAGLLIGGSWFRVESALRDQRASVAALEARHADARARAAIAEQDLQAYRSTARRATALRELLAHHRSWEPFFRLVEARTLPSVRYQSVTADVGGSVAMPATAPSVRAAAEQVVAWEETPGVTGVEISGFSSTADALGVVRGTRFDLRLQFDPSTFSATPVPAPATP